jgi:hypothetical protein
MLPPVLVSPVRVSPPRSRVGAPTGSDPRPVELPPDPRPGPVELPPELLPPLRPRPNPESWPESRPESRVEGGSDRPLSRLGPESRVTGGLDGRPESVRLEPPLEGGGLEGRPRSTGGEDCPPPREGPDPPPVPPPRPRPRPESCPNASTAQSAKTLIVEKVRRLFIAFNYYNELRLVTLRRCSPVLCMVHASATFPADHGHRTGNFSHNQQ